MKPYVVLIFLILELSAINAEPMETETTTELSDEEVTTIESTKSARTAPPQVNKIEIKLHVIHRLDANCFTDFKPIQHPFWPSMGYLG